MSDTLLLSLSWVLPGILTFWPARRIFLRAGLPGGYGALVLIPQIGILLALVVLVAKRWPTMPPAPPVRQPKQRVV
ncbi:hypothetical protein [Arenibaculum pallidiluteum]|uniref:hypothetical protein n=1 Tax=Arenibaculum pallidiluteum TaxID=2812559 RepID=UPI001A970452|nr:hypothetical protein [Arenibaculum pallidiluteum]